MRPLSFSEASNTQLTDSSHCIFLCGLALFFPNFTREDHVGAWTGTVQVSIDFILSDYLKPAPAAGGRKQDGQSSLGCLPTPGDTQTVTKTNETTVLYSQSTAVRNSVDREKRTIGKGTGEGDRAKTSKDNNTHLKTAESYRHRAKGGIRRSL